MVPATDKLGYALKRAQHALRRQMDAALRELPLTTSQYAVLESLAASDEGVSNAALARRCFVTPQAMHGVVTTLERRALILRPDDAEHGRERAARLTRDGTRLLRRARREVEAVEERAFGSLSSQQQARLDATLAMVIDALEEPI